MATSRYVQITDWALLEYEYASETIQNNVAGAYKITNDYDESIQFVNGNIALNLTGNVQDKSSAVQSTVGNKWGYLDIDSIIPIINSDSNLTLTNESSNLTSDIDYDLVKIHIVSGFNLEDLDGIIAQISINERSGKRVDLSNFTFLSSENDYKLNTTPLFIGDRLYDKYIEFKIPALSWIQSEYYANTANPGNFGYIYSSNNEGFVKEGFIDFTLHEITQTTVTIGNKFFVTGNKYQLSFLPADQFGLLGATIKESDEGDYFEYYGTWDNGFPGDYITNLNDGGADWIIIHQLDIFEQLGLIPVRTNNMTIMQDVDYDKPNLIRPVIINSDIASSFSIDYKMRFLNRADGQQIIRESSVTSFDPKKYGKEFEKITVSQGYRPMKVYNKIVSGEEEASSTSFQQSSPGTFKTIVTTKYVPNFYDNTNISISTIGQNAQELDDNIWGQGSAIILLNEFDNLIRFKVFDRSPSDNVLEQLDLTTEPSILLSFVYDDGTKLYVEQSINNETDPTAGEVEFLITGEHATKILEQDNKRFYIISRGGNDDTETVLYQGEYDNFVNREDVNNRLTDVRESDIEIKLKELRAEQEELATRKTSLQQTIIENQELEAEIVRERVLSAKRSKKQLSEKSKQTATLLQAQNAQRQKLAEESAAISKQILDLQQLISQLPPKQRRIYNWRMREVPGKSLDLSIGFKRMKPKVIKPSNPNTNIENIQTNK